ncbi:MAG: RES family NAD+ phosphorylase [Sporichthyaceae bacterium]
MTDLYRVVSSLLDARATAPGHALHVPASRGASRIDNPDRYHALYLGDDPLCAVAEAFGAQQVWTAGMFRGKPSLPGSVQALVTYRLADGAAVCDLDDAVRLVALGLRPSRVVTRDRAITQQWARRLYDGGSFAGVRWWSYYDPNWGSLGLWDIDALSVVDVEPLNADHRHVIAAADRILRPLDR